jgi:hypothetical protein
MRVALVVSALAVVILGIMPSAIVEWAGGAVAAVKVAAAIP